MRSEHETNYAWREKLLQVLDEYEYVSKPRGMEVREILNGNYNVMMPAYLNLKARKINKAFMFAEAYWICSGSNRLADLTPYMAFYKNFSDDGVFLRGAYGPKVVDQLSYVVDSLLYDYQTRQAVLTIWRERPALSKDIPCTVAMQFMIRDKKLHMTTTMRSHDIVLGFTYDVFTFSMVAKCVQLLLREKGVTVELGNLHVNAGSLHMYDQHYIQARDWALELEEEQDLHDAVANLNSAETYQDLLDMLKATAEAFKKEKS